MSHELDRRDFLGVLAASTAMLAATGCKRAPRETIVPYVVQPRDVTPGDPRDFATTMTVDGYAIGLLAESHEGRPTKVRGNPDHPASLGATSALAEASILSLYDPDRARAARRRGGSGPSHDLRHELAARAGARGRGVHLLLEPTTSPTLAKQVARLRERAPEIDLRWHAPLAPRNAWGGAQMAFGAPLEARLALHRADVVLALDADFLSEGPAALVHARAFAERRKPGTPDDTMSRLYVVEPTPSATGLVADHRLAVRPSAVMAVAAAVAIALASRGVPLPEDLRRALLPWASYAKGHDAWVAAVAGDLADHRGAALVIVGEPAPAELHALSHAMNAALGSVGQTVTYAESPILDAGTDAFDLAPLARSLGEGAADTVVVLGGNPAYDAPADLSLAQLLAKAPFSAYVGLHENETAAACGWFAPAAHWLESWGDARAFDGTASLVQPLLAPLFDGLTATEVLAAVLGEPSRSARDLLVSHWTAARRDAAIDSWLEVGVVPDTAIPSAPPPTPRSSVIAAAVARMPLPPLESGPTYELAIRPDAKVRDGALANSPWLQEMPASVSAIVWDNAAFLSRATASRLGVRDGDVLLLTRGTRGVRAPVKVLPGQADDTIAVTLGYGRRGAESLARDVGFDAYALRTRDALWQGTGLRATATGERHELAYYQDHDRLEGRDDAIAARATLAEWRARPRFTAERDKRKLTLYEDTPHVGQGQQWGMVIDLAACTGCGACTVACQAENNVPSVGKVGMAKGRGMHWLRIDRYWIDEPGGGAVLQPMLCQHCEKAPCEYVCPVNATTHSEDGLNQMVYNRCVGTRFCSNNCPYKVRRFNWFNYHDEESPGVARVYNPDVTVRARGVIEKCSLCVQRIREAQIRSRRDRVPMRDGDVATACEEACASRAITFGDLSDTGSRVAQARASGRAFACLNELGTEPRVRYLARLRNPNPSLESPK